MSNEVARLPKCGVCGRSKKPVGRDVAAAAHGSYCTPQECEGYWEGEKPGCRWPSEEVCKICSLKEELIREARKRREEP